MSKARYFLFFCRLEGCFSGDAEKYQEGSDENIDVFVREVCMFFFQGQVWG